MRESTWAQTSFWSGHGAADANHSAAVGETFGETSDPAEVVENIYFANSEAYTCSLLQLTPGDTFDMVMNTG